MTLGVTEDHIGNYYGFWGMIPNAKRDDKVTLWFNSGGQEDMSVMSVRRFGEEIFGRFHIQSVDEIAGKRSCAWAIKNCKKYVRITDPFRFTLRLA